MYCNLKNMIRIHVGIQGNLKIDPDSCHFKNIDLNPCNFKNIDLNSCHFYNICTYIRISVVLKIYRIIVIYKINDSDPCNFKNIDTNSCHCL